MKHFLEVALAVAIAATATTASAATVCEVIGANTEQAFSFDNGVGTYAHENGNVLTFRCMPKAIDGIMTCERHDGRGGIDVLTFIDRELIVWVASTNANIGAAYSNVYDELRCVEVSR